MLRILSFLLLPVLTATQSSAQNAPRHQHSIDLLEDRLEKGDRNAFYEIAPYLDSKKHLTRVAGHHMFQSTEATIARRAIKSNSLFTDQEIVLDASISAKQFTAFLQNNKDRLVFSPLSNKFLITPLEKREARAEFRVLSPSRKKELTGMVLKLFDKPWVREQKIDSLILQKDPHALLQIASAFYKDMNNLGDAENYTNLLSLLTNTEIGVENDAKNLSWHIDKDISDEVRLNLLIYFAANCRQYRWNNELSVFVHPTAVIRPIEKEDELFLLLDNTNDSLAMDAFIQLSVCPAYKVTERAKDYQSAGIRANYELPTFPYNFLQQLSLLTAYCRTNNIDHKGSATLRAYIDQLRNDDLPFKERYALENTIVNTLTLNEITAFEYWALIYEQSWGLTYSAGRILDKFYSKNWKQLLADRKQLELYLQKSIRYYNLGIIGVCNLYLNKFSNAEPAVLHLLQNYVTTDSTVKEQIGRATTFGKKPAIKKIKIWRGNYDGRISGNALSNIDHLVNNSHDSTADRKKIVELLSLISYEQIGEALRVVEPYHFKNEQIKYSFIGTVFGFFDIDFSQKETRETFLRQYARLSEYDLYAWYLDSAGIDYKRADGSLDYDKIYEILKYDVVTAFAGGGGGKMNNHTYLMIKLLELTHKTRLGYAPKLCNSEDLYACYPDERAKVWMLYLEKKKLLLQDHNEPESFTYRNEK